MANKKQHQNNRDSRTEFLFVLPLAFVLKTKLSVYNGLVIFAYLMFTLDAYIIHTLNINYAYITLYFIKKKKSRSRCFGMTLNILVMISFCLYIIIILPYQCVKKSSSDIIA